MTDIVQLELNYPNSSDDCSIRVFCQQVYGLFEQFNIALYSGPQFSESIHLTKDLVLGI